jgi:hydrogenase-4 component F
MLLPFFILSTGISLSIFFAKNNRLTKVLSALFLQSLIAVTTYSYINLGNTDSHYYIFDSLGVLLSFVLTTLSLATFYHSYLYLKRHQFSKKQEAIYYSSLIMLITAMQSAYFAENIALLWVSIEATTLFVSILIFHERSKDALEATWKYLFVSSVGVALAFIGILFLSMAASNNGLTDLSFHNLNSIAKAINPIWLKIAFLLILTGFSVKINLFPLYAVAVDAKTIAASPVNALMSTALVNIGFVAIFRTYIIVAHSNILPWAQNIMMLTGILSIFIATIQITRIKRLKRMYAFSSMEHMGIVSIGLAVGGIGYYAAILHLIFHSLVKAGLFYQIGSIRQFFKSNWIKDSGNYFKLNPIGGLAVILSTISILAIPPSGLFVSEFLTFKALFMEQHYFIAAFVLLLLTIIIFVFSKNSFHLLYGETPANVSDLNVKINPYESISQFLLPAIVIYLGINPPQFFTDLIHAAIAVLN